MIVCDEAKPYVSTSKYIKQQYHVKSEKEAVSLLIELKKQIDEKCVIIACSDGAASAIDLNRDILCDKYIIPGISQQGELTRLMDKEVMSKIGRSIGFDVPETWVVDKRCANLNDVIFPSITKPILSKEGPKSDIKICRSREELESAIKSGICSSFQVQKYIEKSFEYQLIGLSLDGGTIIVIPGVSHCIRPCPRTNTGYLRYEAFGDEKYPLKKCYEYIKQIGYTGLFSMEFLRGKDGKYYFMEINFRNDGNSICVTKAGFNLPYLLYTYYVKGRDVFSRELSLCTLTTTYVMPEFDDHQFVSMGEISLWHWVRDVFRADAYMEFDKTDVKPFFVRLCELTKDKFSRSFKHR